MKQPTVPTSQPVSVLTDIVCNRCGCGCDDLRVTVHHGAIANIDHGCHMARDWFAAGVDETLPCCRVGVQDATWEAGLDAAVEILRASRYPLIYGLCDTTCEAQRQAVAIADWCGGAIDIPTASQLLGSRFVATGEISTTLGEILHRADLLLFWYCDPDITAPRFRERLIDPAGRFMPTGRVGRYLVAVRNAPVAGQQDFDEIISVAANDSLEFLWKMRDYLQHGRDSDDPVANGLALRLRHARYPVILYDAHSPDALAIATLVKDANLSVRCASLALRGAGNMVGAEQVLLWRTGFSGAVDFSAGHPRQHADAYSADKILSAKSCDCLLQIGDLAGDSLSTSAREHLNAIPRIALLPARSGNGLHSAAVTFFTAVAGLTCAGTTYRMDGVPLPLRSLLSTKRRDDAAVLAAMAERLQPK